MIGTVNQIQAINNVSYGGVYFGTWYRNYDQDAGSAVIRYENDLHISYTQNFVSRRSAGRRGAIITRTFQSIPPTDQIPDDYDGRSEVYALTTM